MKKHIAVLTLIAGTCFGQANVTITNWYPNYKYINATNEDVGTTGLATGTAYVCFALADFDFLSATDADHAAGDIRAVQFALAKDWFDVYDTATTNNPAPDMLTIGENSTYDASTNADIALKLTIQTKLILSGSGVGIPAETE